MLNASFAGIEVVSKNVFHLWGCCGEAVAEIVFFFQFVDRS